MRKLLLLSLAIGMASLTNVFAGITFCLTNWYGEKTTLYVSGRSGSTLWLTGEIDYTPVGSTVWPCSGSYNIVTRSLKYTATNPNPDFCTLYADKVDFYYTVYLKTISGGFSNNCGVSGNLNATVYNGKCPFSAVTLKKGEYGGTGSHKMFRTKLPLPEGQSLDEILQLNSISVSPNPVSKVANINVTLAASTKVTINIYNKEGALVYTVINSFASGGKHSYTWNLQTKNGTAKTDYYIVKLITKDGEQSAQILVTR